MPKIKFTDGIWIATIANDFTTDTVARLSKAVSVWLLNKNKESSVVIGYDARFGGKLFSETAAKVFALMGIKVYISTDIINAAMLSLGVNKKNTNLGIFITANNEKPKYNGIILIGSNGISISDQDLKLIESLVPPMNEIDLTLLKWEEYKNQGFIEYYNIEDDYLKYLNLNFNIDSLNKFSKNILIDAFHSCSQNILKKIFSNSKIFNIDRNPLFKDSKAHPFSDELTELSTRIKKTKDIKGIAFSSDSKYITLFTEQAKYINSYQVFLLLIHSFAKYKKIKGSILIESYTTNKIEILASHHNLEVKIIEPGSNNFEGHFIKENALLGINKKNEIFIHSQIPQPDGIWTCLAILDILQKSNKSLSELCTEVNEITGTFVYEFLNIETNNITKNEIMKSCKKGKLIPLGECKTIQNNEQSVYKFSLDNNNWILISPKKQGLQLTIFTQKISREETIEKINEIRKKLSLF